MNNVKPKPTNNNAATPKSRAGKNFTPKGKAEISADNIKKNGVEKCEGCGVNTTKPEKSTSGVTPPKTDRQYDHIEPKSKGGEGIPSNGQILCRECNRDKSNN